MEEAFKPEFSAKSGVKKWVGRFNDYRDRFQRDGYWAWYIVGKEVFATTAEARKAAENGRVARIAQLERQLAKLKALSHAE